MSDHPKPPPARRHQRPRRTGVSLVAAGLLGAMALTACSGGGTSSTASSAAVGSELSARDGSAGSAGAPAAGAGTGDAKAAPAIAKPGTVGSTVKAATAAQMLARAANLSIKVKDLGVSATRMRSAALTFGGIVTSENLQTRTDLGEEGMSGTIAISVPSPRLDEALDKLGGLGSVTDRQVSSEDVTAQVVDTQSRVKTQQASVDRVRALMSQATRIEQVVALESELAQREADLEALETGLASLKDRVAMSPIIVTLFTTKAPVPVRADTGFLSGLRNGWHAFSATTTALLTVIGGALPFAIFLALVGVPLWTWRQRRMARRGQGAASGPSGPTAPAAAVTAQP